MPMYEKGSVRAGPRSKQQERMKKIMKKFLSSLLAMTMILSLVIVPANAANEITGASGNIVVGDTTTLSVTKPTKVTVSGQEYEVKTATVTSWTSATTSVATVPENSTADSVVVTAVAEGSSEITCALNVTYYKVKAAESVQEQTDTTPVSYKTTVNVISAETNLKNTLNNTNIYYKGRTFKISLSGATLSATIKYVDGETIDKTDLTFSATGVNATDYSGSTDRKTLTVKKGDVSTTIAVTEEKVTLRKPEIKTTNVTSNSIRVGEKGVLTADYTAVFGTSNELKYQWYKDGVAIPRATEKALDLSDTTAFPVSSTAYSITVEVTDKGAATESDAYSLTVNRDRYTVAAKSGYKTSMVPGQSQSLEISVTGEGVVSPTYRVVWASSKTDVADFTSNSKDKNTGVLVANNKSGYTTVTATVTFENKDYPVTFDRISVSAADATLDEITNGKSDYLSDTSLKDVVAKAINKSTDSKLSGSDISTIKVATSGFPSHIDLYEDEVKTANKITSTTKDLTTVDYLYFDADKGYIGTSELNLNVTLKAGGNGTIAVTLYIPVVGDDKIDATVNGSSAKNDVSFKVSDAVDYSYLYVYGSKSSPSTSKPSDYDGYWTKTATTASGWAKCSSSDTITVPNSKFSNGKATLYVVGLESDGTAHTGTITVSQKSYDINYNVVAGKSVSFSQKDFEDFLENYAEDNGNYNSRKDEITFDHATLNSLPDAKREGTLYYGGSEVTSTSNRKAEYTDMDKMTFEAVAKPTKDTVTLTFRVYGEIEKPNSRKPDKVDYTVNVVINVVKEDITYTVGIDDTVQMTARDFVNFLQDARTSYRKAELDYVKFDVSGKNVSSYAYGGLYRSYSSYSTGKLADSTDKFYYEPSRTQYDLADVAYHTTRWAEAGKTVYIPFTVYGTKNEEASGTMAITIAQTMNFIDVKASDFFYEPVKWAVNNKITNGTSSTTFSPYKNCNRAEIVTFLWRAAGSPEPTSTRNPFTDVNSVRDASYYKAILWASQKGITAGTNATTFSPYQECTRSQIVTFLYRYAGKPSGYYSNPFKDVSSVNEASYYNAILWAVGKGITQGTSTTTFSPYASCTRGEAVTFLYRYVNGVK